MAAGASVEAEGAAWVAATALTPEGNGNLTGTVAATDRKYSFLRLLLRLNERAMFQVDRH